MLNILNLTIYNIKWKFSNNVFKYGGFIILDLIYLANIRFSPPKDLAFGTYYFGKYQYVNESIIFNLLTVYAHFISYRSSFYFSGFELDISYSFLKIIDGSMDEL